MADPLSGGARSSKSHLKSGVHGPLHRRLWSRFILWEVRHPWTTLALCGAIAAALVYQGGKLPKRLKGGLVSLKGSESQRVLETVEKDFSTAIAYPTILVQAGSEDRATEAVWNKALGAVQKVPSVRSVIDMHLGREIVGMITANTQTEVEAQEMIRAMRAQGIPEGFKEDRALRVDADYRVSVVVKTDVRSFKEGEARRKAVDECIARLPLPSGSSTEMTVVPHRRRNFALIEADVHSYQEAETLTAGLQRALHEQDLPDDAAVRVTGLPALLYDLNREAVSALRKAEWIGVPICFLLLCWVFGSPAAAALPVTVALVALATGSAVMSKIGKFMEISMFVPSVLSMIGLGVGVDYMLILVSRFRECMARHPNTDEAIMRAMQLTAPTLFGSGFTVAIGFSALAVSPLMLFRAMGIAGIVVILSSLACIFILAPPLFKVTSRWIRWNKPIEARTPFWRRWTQFVTNHPISCLVSGLTLMLALASPVLDLEMVSLNPEALPSHIESRKGYVTCKDDFGAGWLMPAVILVTKPESESEEDYLAREQQFIRRLRAMDTTFDAVGASDLKAARSQGFTIEIPPDFFISKSGRHHLILAMYDGNPMSPAGRHWVETLRQKGREMWTPASGHQCGVGGVVANTLDIDRTIFTYLLRTAIFCMATTFLCLAWLYRSIFIPLQAILMNLLSVSAAYGFAVMWFQKGLGAWMAPTMVVGSYGINSIIVLLLFCALFGLSMDYQVFLLGRIHEEWRHSHNNRLAVRQGIELTGRVVTGAAAIMIAIFLSFAFVSVLETRQFGAGMAAAILFDATIIRLLIFPSAMLLMGRLNWWWPFRRKHAPPESPPRASALD